MAGELFPREVTSNVPRLTLTGRERLYIEQHRGLLDYSPEQIAIRTSCGILRVNGSGMCFSLYTSAEACISGEISGVCFDHREARG